MFLRCRRPAGPGGATPRRLFALFLALALFGISVQAAAATKLWLAFDGNTGSCKVHVDNFFKCVLEQTNFNTLALKYNNGEPLHLAGSVVLSKYCAPSDFQCVVSTAGFAVTPYDVVVHFYGTSWGGGTNGMRTVTVNGQSVTINVAWVQSGSNCDAQTCTGSHEAFEAATDGVSADCCNGQYNHPSCTKCQPSCAKYDTNNGNPPWGCYDLTCPSGTYKMELLSDSQANEYSASSCTQLTMQGCGGGGTALNQPCNTDSDCCSGLSCKLWDYDGQPPYSNHCCKDLGQSCSANTDCCGGMNCTSGKCACVPDGQWCLNAGECCGGDVCDTTAHTCVAASGAGGAAGSGGAAATAGAAGMAGSSGAAAAGGAGGALEAGVDSGMAGVPAGEHSRTTTPSGCGCRLPGEQANGEEGLLAFSLLGLALVAERRRKRRVRG